jgi:hypothetical protein
MILLAALVETLLPVSRLGGLGIGHEQGAKRRKNQGENILYEE